MRDIIVLYHPKVDFWPYYPCFWAPLSVMAIAGALRQSGFKILIQDGNLSEMMDSLEQLQSIKDRIFLVGISAMIGGKQGERAVEYSKSIKKMHTSIPVVIGGGFATIAGDVLLKEISVNYVIRGQGENPMISLVNVLAFGGCITGIKGLATADTWQLSLPEFQDRSNFQPFSWDLVNVENYVRSDPFGGPRTINFVSSQGCPHRCGYCNEPFTCKSEWCGYSAERTFLETEKLVVDYNLSAVKFYDPNFFVNRKRVIEFCEKMLLAKNKFRWSASAHPRGLNRFRDEVELLSRSGLSRLLIGAESGSQQVLDFVKKGCKVAEIISSAELCRRAGINATFTFIVGFPGIVDDLESTFHLIREIKRINNKFEIKIHFFSPFPGTVLGEVAKQFGYDYPNSLMEWSRHDYYQAHASWVDGEYARAVEEFRSQL